MLSDIIYEECAFRIAVGIMALVLVMAGGAGATKFINNNATGGDCISFGTWNAATMTCTMTTDLTEGIQVISNGVTLDGNGYTITSNVDNAGVLLSGRSGVTIKNINTKNNYIGIDLGSSNNNILSGNNATSNRNSGINMASSNNNMLSNNNANSNNGFGIYMGNSNNNILSSNSFSNDNIGIYLFNSNYNTLNSNDASNNIASGYSGIYLTYSINNTLNGNNASNNSGCGIYLIDSSNSILSGNNANSNNGYGIYLTSSGYSMLSNNNANSNNNIGIYLSYSSNSMLSGNNAMNNTNVGIYLAGYYNTLSNYTLSNNNANSNNGYGIYLYSGSNNTLSNNNANSNNLYSGIYLDQTNNNTLSGNNASKNNFGIYLSNSPDNTLKGNTASSNYNTGIYLDYNPGYSFSNNIYNNYFFNTINYGSGTGKATWNTTRTSATNIIGGPYLGGNFWANPSGTGFSQTCIDIDRDGICDSEYNLDSNNIDYLPLSRTFNVTMDNTPPVADCGVDKLKCENVGAKVQFNASASYDLDGSLLSYAWEFGDDTIGTGVAPNHTYAAYRWNGSAYQPFTVNLTVTDNSSFTNKTSQNVTIWIAGDANGDGKVNILDASVIGLKWSGNDPCADLNNDGKVNILDASIIGLKWGKPATIGG